MGVSTDAILVYGFEVGEEDDKDHDRCDTLSDADYATLTKAEKELNAQLVYHCSDTCTEYVLGLKYTYARAYRGSPGEINIMALAAFSRKEMDAQLVTIATALGLTPKPGRWILCSWWG